MAAPDARPIYIGDELGATGYQLAGAEVQVVNDRDALGTHLDAALERAELILLGAGVAQWLSQPELQALLRRTRPLVVVVPDFSSDAQPADLSTWLRGQLGMTA